MSDVEYYRPHTLDEALALIAAGGSPIGGGSRSFWHHKRSGAIVDLQALGLDKIQFKGDQIVLGATTRLQALLDAESSLPPALVRACRQEAGLNLRNMTTVAGTLMACDGRSPLVTCLLALGASATTEPGAGQIELQSLLQMRGQTDAIRLLTAISFPRPQALAFEHVARSPADLPVVCVAVARLPALEGAYKVQIALGGYGLQPVRATAAEAILAMNGDIVAAAESVQRHLGQAGDAWASAQYRSAVAAILTGRLLGEAMN